MTIPKKKKMTLLMVGLYAGVCQSFLCEHLHHTNAINFDTTASS